MNSIFLTLTIVAVLPSPPTDDKTKLIGTWSHAERVANAGEVAVEMTFGPKGEFHGFMTVNGQKVWNFSGTWSFAESRLDYVYKKSDWANVPVGMKDRDEVLEVTKKHLRLKCVTGAERTYSRVVRQEKAAEK
jgi:hypothetical protein